MWLRRSITLVEQLLCHIRNLYMRSSYMSQAPQKQSVVDKRPGWDKTFSINETNAVLPFIFAWCISRMCKYLLKKGHMRKDIKQTRFKLWKKLNKIGCITNFEDTMLEIKIILDKITVSSSCYDKYLISLISFQLFVIVF